MQDRAPLSSPSAVLVAGLPLRLLPAWPLTRILVRLVSVATRRHPGISERLADHAGRRLLILPRDLPLAFLLEPTRGAPKVRALPGDTAAGIAVDATLRAPLADLIALAEGRVDGDALFFSRRLHLSGDTELVLAFRNALDDARIDLVAVAMEALGPVAPVGGRALDFAHRVFRRFDADLATAIDLASGPLRARVDEQAGEIERLKAELEGVRPLPRQRVAGA